MNEPMAGELRRKLPYAWQPFFGRFGQLTAVQFQTIPIVLAGRSAVVSSPTASGKTEAVVAPIAERCVSERLSGTSVIYIVPTRALANDTLHRIQGPLQDMGLLCDVKHGDRPYISKKLPPDFLITTPESLDSLLCRKHRSLHSVNTVIVDEIHMVDNTIRGDQLRVLLKRLHHLTDQRNIVSYLLSATLSDPAAVASRYISDFDTISVEGNREIVYYPVESYRKLHEIARQKKWRKILVFCNYRASAERVAAKLSELWHPYPVVVHHGSLARGLREEAESVMREVQAALCVSTATLEVGIDIGNIDAIVFAEVPWSMASLLQRLGRGNRREDRICVVDATETEKERGILETMIKLAKTGTLFEEVYKPDLSVAAQQALSIAFQHLTGIDMEMLIELMSPLTNAAQALAIVTHLTEKGFLEETRGQLFPSSSLMDMADRGKIHSNISDRETFKVIDVQSGKEIGQVGVVDEVFVLGRRAWKVVSTTASTIKVKGFRGKASAANFRRHFGNAAFSHLLPRDIATLVG